jgi:hypothetical protein
MISTRRPRINFMKNDVKLVIGNASSKVGGESVHQPTIGRYSLHDSTNETGFETWHSADGHTYNQIDHCLINGRHIDSDHMLVIIKLRYRISRPKNKTSQQLRRFAIERLNVGNIATIYRYQLEAELSAASEDGKSKRMENAVWKIATNTIGYTRIQASR